MHSYYYGSYSGWGASPFFGLGGLGLAFGLVILIVVLVLKGFALWYAAKKDQKWWFAILLVVNTLGILELVYLLAVAKVWPHKPGSSSTHGSQDVSK